ncbi:hypothetical protein GCM10029992_36630 [Glycomyces albus]
MTDTETKKNNEIDYDAIEAKETQRVLDSIARFRDGLDALKSTEGAECGYQYEQLLAACVDGQLALADFVHGMSGFFEDMWPKPVGQTVNEAVAGVRGSAYALASVYGLVTRIPEDPAASQPIVSGNAA